MPKTKPIVGIGDCVLDVVVGPVPDEWVTGQHLKVGSSVQALAPPFPNGLPEESERISIKAGGSTFTALAWAQHALRKKAGTQCTFLGTVGNDQAGEFFRQQLDATGVTGAIGTSQRLSTGVTQVFITAGGERTLSCYAGASNETDPRDVFQYLTNGPGIILCDLYLAGRPGKLPQYMEMASEAREAGHDLVISLGGVEVLAAHHPTELCDLLTNSIVLGSQSEWDASGLRPSICKMGVKTLGEQGALLFEGDKELLVPARKVEEEEVVNSLNAGDAVTGGFIAGLAAGLTPEEALAGGMYFAAKVVEMEGGLPSGSTTNRSSGIQGDDLTHLEPSF